MSTDRKIKCPFCGSTKVEFIGICQYKCSECKKEFNVIEHAESLMVYGGLAVHYRA